jgi:hypothetical protein
MAGVGTAPTESSESLIGRAACRRPTALLSIRNKLCIGWLSPQHRRERGSERVPGLRRFTRPTPGVCRRLAEMISIFINSPSKSAFRSSVSADESAHYVAEFGGQ